MQDQYKNKFRASFSVLNTWASGDWERAIKYYFHLEKFTSPAMAEGQKYHEQWAEEIKKTNCMPKVFGGMPLTNPEVEKYERVELAPWLDLSGKIDLLDNGVVYDWKTGKASSECSASSQQIGVYGVLCTYSGKYVNKGEIHHYDQYIKKVDISSVWITDKLLDNSLNWIITLSGEMQNYILENKLYERFNGSRTW